MNVVIRADTHAPVVLSPDAASEPVGALPAGITVQNAELVDGATGRWAKLPLYAGDRPLLRAGTSDALYGYIAAQYIVGALQPQPAPTALVKVGVSVIFQREAAMNAAQAGCRFFCIIANAELGSAIKDAYPDATVIVRPYVDVHGALPPIDYVLGKMNGASDPRLIYTGLNEAEQVGQDPNGIRLRSGFDVEMAKRVRANGGTYAAGSFSVGTPDITSQAVCDAMRQYYAPHFNAGEFWWDQHLYSPNPAHIYREDTQTPVWNGVPQVIAEHEWFETRWRFFYRRCGFDPNSPSRIVSSETGLDQGGIGGFPAHNQTGTDVVNWCKRFLQISALPIMVDGVEYPSPFVGGAIFTSGDPVNWAGYDMARYLPDLGAQVWQAHKVFIPGVAHG
jgi:hypothetical protein